jgi:signal transduction histidine kinase
MNIQPHLSKNEEWDMQPTRREQDLITQVETTIRRALLNTGVDSGDIEHWEFIDAVHHAAFQIATTMDEVLVEVWLMDLPPWGTGESPSQLQLHASIAPRYSDRLSRVGATPDDILFSVLTAGRPLRFDNALNHPLVHQWAIAAGVDPEVIEVFLGIPIFHHSRLYGVVAVAISYAPTAEHVHMLDMMAEYIAIGAQYAHTQYTLHSQRELAQTVLREAPLASAVLRPNDYTIILTNALFDRLLQIGPDVWGQQLESVLPDHAPLLRVSLHLDEISKTGESRTIVELPIRLAGGLTYWDFTCSPIQSSTGTIEGILIAGVDVTIRVTQRLRQKRNVDVAQERVYQMVALHQTSLEVASQLGQDPHTVLRQIVERMATLVEATGGTVLYANRDTGELEVVISTGLTKDYTGIRLKRGEGLAGRAFITGEGQWVDNYHEYLLRSDAFKDEPFSAVAAIPMKQWGKVIGVICLMHVISNDPLNTRRGDEVDTATFTPEDLAMLDLFAAQAAHAIESSRNYKNLEEAYQEQRAVDRQKDDFIARFSHDLKLPLTSIIGFLDLALAIVEDKSELQPILKQASDDAQQLGEMLDQLLAQARLDSGKREVYRKPVRLVSVIEDVVRARHKQIEFQGTDHRIETLVKDDLVVMADLARFKEVLENLISNAVKYSPHGGMITITTSAENTQARITIKDNGIGIPPESHDKIFERFTRLESPLASEIRGTGLGLYLARQLIESMGGKLWLEHSILNEGSTFAFTLPLSSSLGKE